MRRRSAPRAGVVVVAALGLLAVPTLTSCASIPTHGAVVDTSPTTGVSADRSIRVLARPPHDGANQRDVVAGFLAASASFDDDHAIARSYLTTSASSTWLPSSHVAVYESMPGYRLSGAGPSVTMTALHSAGSMTARGQFVQPLDTGPFVERFGLRRVDGEWRISSLPQGLVLSTADVSRAYRSLNLYFTDITGGVLVPDPVFVPANEPGIATTLVRETLTGPTAWLAPAVRTGFPTGTRLAVDSVPVQGGIARVDLTTTALSAGDAERRQLAAQLAYELEQLEGVTGVRITVSGVPLPVPGSGPVTHVSDWPGFDPAARPLDPSTYVVADSRLAIVVASRTRPVEGYFGSTAGLGVSATSADGLAIAGSYGVGGRDVVRVGQAGQTDAPTVYRGGDVGSLSWDRFGTAWVTELANGSPGVWTVRAGRAPLHIKVRGLGGRTVRVLRVSRDGARVALIVSSAGRASGELLVGRVQRPTDSAGPPVVAGLRRVENSLSSVIDVGWAGATTLLVAAQGSMAATQAFTVDLDGYSVEGVGTVPAMTSVAACPGRAFLAGSGSGSGSGEVWSDRGSGWRPLVRGSVPVYPG